MKLQLPNVTLIALTSRDFEGHKKAIDKSCEGIEFGARKIIYDLDIKNIDDWSRKVVYDLPKYVDTSHALLIHSDGFIQNPEVWRDEWLHYDFAGSPWPLPKDDFSYRSESGKIQRVGNSVSLRSKRLMELAATRPWRSYYGNWNEDGFISCHNREWLESMGCNFMPFKEAVHFGKEIELPEHAGVKSFVFHEV